MKKIKIAIVGASGLVGSKIIEILNEENLLKNVELHLFASGNNTNRHLFINNFKYKLKVLTQKNIPDKLDIVFFSAGEDVSKTWAKFFADRGAFVIDNSSTFRKDNAIPLIVPEINFDLKNSKIISNPNCSTIQLALAINLLQKFGNIEKIVVSTYQSVSGAGKKALEDYINKTNFEIKEGISGNVISKIGKISENGFCEEENKIMFELNKILNKNYSICASTVRVPIPFCHTESVYVKFVEKININDIKCDDLNYIKISDDIVLPSDVANTNVTYIIRLRQFSDKEIAFFVIADNLRRGAAYNAVLIAKKIIDKYFTKN